MLQGSGIIIVNSTFSNNTIQDKQTLFIILKPSNYIFKYRLSHIYIAELTTQQNLQNLFNGTYFPHQSLHGGAPLHPTAWPSGCLRVQLHGHCVLQLLCYCSSVNCSGINYYCTGTWKRVNQSNYIVFERNQPQSQAVE